MDTKEIFDNKPHQTLDAAGGEDILYYDVSPLEDGFDISKCIESAQNGCAAAQSALGWCYEYAPAAGLDMETDIKKAVYWFRKAAEQGAKAAQFHLAYCYDYGEGVERDDREAAKWYKKSAEQGLGISQCCIGSCYKEGSGVEKDLNEAAAWFKKAAEQGFTPAQRELDELHTLKEESL